MDNIELFTTKVLRKEENVQRSLYEVVKEYENNELILPEFQRQFCWTNSQITGWIDSVMKGKAIGVIVTYQSTSDGQAVYLADGLQRLTATLRFLKSPFDYGYKFGVDQAKEYCKAYSITVQHRLYNDHREAMRAFQNLNKGTSLTPEEFFKGELSLDERGRLILSKIPQIISVYESQFYTKKKLGRQTTSKLNRDSLSLFYQYFTKSTAITLHNVTMLNNVGINIENDLIAKIEGISLSDLDKSIRDFDGFIAQEVAEIRDFIDRTNNRGKAISPTVFHWLLHVSIWRKNTNKPVKLYSDFMLRFFQEQSLYRSITSSFVLPNSDPAQFVRLAINDVGSLGELSTAFDIPLYINAKRLKKLIASNGYNESHYDSFAGNGNGKTFIEPASRNKSRGINPVGDSA